MSRTKSSISWLAFTFMAILTSCQTRAYQLHGSPYESPQPAPDFVIESTRGEVFRLAEQEGKITLLYFGYTYCPDICPTTLVDVQWVVNELGELSDQVDVILVTVDPERDTLSRLQDYLAIFNPAFVGARAEGEELEALKLAYGVYAERDPSEDPESYLVTHTSRVFLIDRDGKLISNYSFGTPKEELLEDLKYLLKNP